jgi:serine/threonine-protein kinase HipA
MSGISGVQPKVLIPQKSNASNDVVEKTSIKDATYIVKAAGADYDGLTENEYHCMSIVQQAGLDVPRFWLSDDKGLFIVERFDRGSNGDYLGFEDMTSLTGRQNSEKYEGSYEMVAKAVSLFSAKRYIPESLRELFKSIVLSVVVRNGDAHLKNFGILYTHPAADDARLSPLYDIVNTTTYIPKDLLALKMDKKRNWPDRETLIEFGRNHCQLARPADIIDMVCDAANEYKPIIETEAVWDAIRPIINAACFSLSGGKASK